MTEVLLPQKRAIPATGSSRADRKTSFDLAEIPLPSGREEDWRFTPIAQLKGLMEDVLSGNPPILKYAGETLDSPVEIPGLRIEKVARGEGLVGQPGDRTSVVAWNNTVETNKIRVTGENKEPLYLTLNGLGKDPAADHLLIDVAPGAQATIVLEMNGSAQITQTVEVKVGKGSNLEFVTIEEYDDESIYACNQRIELAEDANLRHVVVTLGGSLTRVCTDVVLAGEHCEANLFGTYFTGPSQHHEHRVFVDHQAPNCKSEVTYKGALRGQGAHSVWVGDVLVGAEAEGTDTYELNRNLVIGLGPRADSVPNLEIKNGEIEGAGHASATGRFDDEQLFYLCSRGIEPEEAKRLVLRGFFADLLANLRIPQLEEHLMKAVENKLQSLEGVE